MNQQKPFPGTSAGGMAQDDMAKHGFEPQHVFSFVDTCQGRSLMESN